MASKELIEHIITKNYASAKDLVEQTLNDITSKKLVEVKKIIMAEEYTIDIPDIDIPDGELEELDEAARIKIVRARIRGGKVQRRKKVSGVAGYTLKAGKLKRMSVTERRNRKLGQRRGKIKRKAKLNRSLMKRKRSMMKRKSMGI